MIELDGLVAAGTRNTDSVCRGVTRSGDSTRMTCRKEFGLSLPKGDRLAEIGFTRLYKESRNHSLSFK